MDRVGYEPVSVTRVLAEMKDTASVLVDLSYSAVLYGDREIAEEVLALEERMDVLQLQARMSLMMAVRSPSDAEALAPVLGVVGAAEKISDAAGDIAKVVLDDVGLPEALRTALPEAAETLARARVTPDSPLADRTLGGLGLETETGVRVVAVHRSQDADVEWLLDPDRDTRLQADDALVLRGPEAGVAEVYERATGTALRRPAATQPSVEDLGRAVDVLVLMKNTSELAVDVAYGAVLFDSADLAEEVFELEAEVDALKERFEAWTLQAAAGIEDPVSLRGLVHIGASTEVISDAALEISEGVLRGLGTHPVVAEAVNESDEVLVRVTVGAASALDGVTIGDGVGDETGARIVAVRRTGPEDSAWVVSPGGDTDLEAGDVLLATGTRRGVIRLADLADDEVDVQPER